MIKITHINPTDIKGGASLAGYRLHKELLKETDIDSVLFVYKKYTNDKEVIQFSNIVFLIIDKILNKIWYILGLQYLLNINWLGMLIYKRFWKTDVFIIRMVHGGYLPFWLPWLLGKIAPVIWRFPDQWAFTGHCAYSYDCKKYEKVCKKCPYLKEYPSLWFDSTPLLFRIKKFVYNHSNLHIIAPSKWMESLVKKSFLSNPTYIPTGVDENVFKPREKFNRPSLISVSVKLKDKRKGSEIFLDILSKLNERLKKRNMDIDLYWIGEKNTNMPILSNIHNMFLGFLKEDELAKYYAKSHAFILPTLADNLPNTLLESLSCNTPAVSFDVGGCKDVVKHKETGYLVKKNDINGFVDGIIYCLDNNMNGRKLILDNFTMEQQRQRYLELIHKILK